MQLVSVSVTSWYYPYVILKGLAESHRLLSTESHSCTSPGRWHGVFTSMMSYIAHKPLASYDSITLLSRQSFQVLTVLSTNAVGFLRSCLSLWFYLPEGLWLLLSNLQNACLLHVVPHPERGRPSISASWCLASLSPTWPPSSHLGPGLHGVAPSSRELS